MNKLIQISASALALIFSFPGLAQGADPATKVVSPLPMPPSVSEEVRDAYEKLTNAPPQPDFGGDIAALRKWNADQEEVRLRAAEQLFPVRSKSRAIRGVKVDVVVPLSGIAPENQSRVLINLHGGGFMWGGGRWCAVRGCTDRWYRRHQGDHGRLSHGA